METEKDKDLDSSEEEVGEVGKYHHLAWVVYVISFIALSNASHGIENSPLNIIYSFGMMTVVYLCYKEKKINPTGYAVLFLYGLSIVHCLN